MNLTYNQIIKEFNIFADKHEQINSFGNGDLWEVVEHNQLPDFNYNLLWVQDGNVTLGNKIFTWNFNVLCMGMVEKDEVNENDVKSDTSQVLFDLLSYLEQKTNTTDYGTKWTLVNLVKSGSMRSFTERFEDAVTGWTMTVGLEIPNDYNDCDLPII